MAMMKTSDGEIVDFQNVFRLAEGRFGNDMVELWDPFHMKPREGLLMGCPLWGAEFIASFEKYCVPSLLAPANIAALKGRSRLVLFTNVDGFIPLVNLAKKIQRHGIEVGISVIQPEFFAEMEKHRLNKYWMLGTLQNTLIQMAGKWGMAVHMLFPDVIYNREFFPNLDRLGKQHGAVVLAGPVALSCEELCGEIEACRDGDTLSIEARDLGNMGLCYLHPMQRIKVLNGRNLETDMPAGTIWVAWAARTKFCIYTAHTNMAWLSADLCARAPSRIPATIDAELPIFMPRFYTPKADDGLAYLEINEPSMQRVYSTERLSFSEFAQGFWTNIKFDDRYMPFFNECCEVPVHDVPGGLDEEEIQRQHAYIVRRLHAEQAKAALAQIRELGGDDTRKHIPMPVCINARPLPVPPPPPLGIPPGLVWSRRTSHGHPLLAEEA